MHHWWHPFIYLHPVFKVSSSKEHCLEVSSSFTAPFSFFLFFFRCFDAYSSCSIRFLQSGVKFGELKAPPLVNLSNKSTVMQILVFKTISSFVPDIQCPFTWAECLFGWGCLKRIWECSKLTEISIVSYLHKYIIFFLHAWSTKCHIEFKKFKMSSEFD